MLELSKKKILTIDLTKKTTEVKTFSDLHKYIGGVGLGIKLYDLYKDTNPLIFAIGPLNGFYPFASKTAVVLNSSNALEDIYLGGNLSLTLKFTGIDAIVITGQASEDTILDILDTKVDFKFEDTKIDTLGLPGKRSVLTWEANDLILNGYFHTQEGLLEKEFRKRKIKGVVITGTETYSPVSFDKYSDLYKRVLAKEDELSVKKGIYPSCGNCPRACGKSRVGEMGGNVLIHSLVACAYADIIYSDIGIVFSCLNTLGYDYSHEDIEQLPHLIEQTLKQITNL